jgi:hypothetical protein
MSEALQTFRQLQIRSGIDSIASKYIFCMIQSRVSVLLHPRILNRDIKIDCKFAIILMDYSWPRFCFHRPDQLRIAVLIFISGNKR